MHYLILYIFLHAVLIFTFLVSKDVYFLLWEVLKPCEIQAQQTMRLFSLALQFPRYIFVFSICFSKNKRFLYCLMESAFLIAVV